MHAAKVRPGGAGFTALTWWGTAWFIHATITFYYPGMYGALVLGCIAAGLYTGAFLWWAAAISLVSLFAVYAVVSYIFLDAAYLKGSCMYPEYFSQFLHTHPYFPVTTYLWDGNDYVHDPCPEHRAIYNMEERTHVIAQHPHGPVAIGAGMTLPQLTQWGLDFVAPLRVATASAVMYAPIIRDLYALFGAVDASRSVLDRAMAAGKSILVLPGGIREQLYRATETTEPVKLQSRKGFIRLALRHGSMLTPSLVFGERRLYAHSPALHGVAKLIKAVFNMGIPAIAGRWGSLVPHPRPVDIVLGKPLDTVVWLAKYRAAHPPSKEKEGEGGGLTSRAAGGGTDADAAPSAEASDDEVTALLEEYTANLVDMFEELKGRFGYEGVSLQIR